jgi:hypothetical protein
LPSFHVSLLGSPAPGNGVGQAILPVLRSVASMNPRMPNSPPAVPTIARSRMIRGAISPRGPSHRPAGIPARPCRRCARRGRPRPAQLASSRARRAFRWPKKSPSCNAGAFAGRTFRGDLVILGCPLGPLSHVYGCISRDGFIHLHIGWIGSLSRCDLRYAHLSSAALRSVERFHIRRASSVPTRQS